MKSSGVGVVREGGILHLKKLSLLSKRTIFLSLPTKECE